MKKNEVLGLAVCFVSKLKRVKKDKHQIQGFGFSMLAATNTAASHCGFDGRHFRPSHIMPSEQTPMEEFDSEELEANMMGMKYYCTVLEWG